MSAPRRVGAIAPSSRALAELITREIDPRRGPVIELGAGTGSFTRQLIALGVPESNLVLIELGETFAEHLTRCFPRAQVHCADARSLSGLVMPSPGRAGAVVSGLPLLSMPLLPVVRVLRGAFGHLCGDGAFYQFTYGPRCPVPAVLLEHFGLKSRCLGMTLANVPPARVFRISRRGRASERL